MEGNQKNKGTVVTKRGKGPKQVPSGYQPPPKPPGGSSIPKAKPNSSKSK